MTAFEEMGVMPELAQAVEEMDWGLPTDIQAEGIPMILGGGDVLMAAETGSGKTGAFCLPILQIVYETLKDVQEGKGGKGKVAGASSQGTSSIWKMNVFDRGDQMAIDTEHGLLCQSRDQHGWQGTRATKGVTGQGKYYFEGTVTDEGLCRVGWSTMKASHDIGTDRESFGFGGTGKKSFAKQFDSYGESYGIGDVVGSYIDLDLTLIKWSKNGVVFPTAYEIPAQLRNAAFFPSVCLKNAELKFNFGDTPFKYPPTGGFIAVNQAPKTCVVNSKFAGGATIQPKVPKPNAPYAIIMEPSRELAEQTFNQIEKFKKYLSNPAIRELLLVGGGSAKEQSEALQRGIEIVVATPGRLGDMVSTGTLDLSSCRFFVLDECDGLLSQGNERMIEDLHKQIPKVTHDGKRLQMVVCSATLHSFAVKKMAEKLMHFPTWIDLKGQDSVPETVHHVVLHVDPKVDQQWKQLKNHVATDGVHQEDQLNHGIETPEMLSEAVKMIKGEYTVKAIREHKMEGAIIFCRTKLDCDNMEKYLVQKGGGHNKNTEFSCVCLHSDRKPAERSANLNKFKEGKVKFLICTDVAARGIDVRGLPYVINVTLPDEKENYVHRIGRVGRADRMGLAISFVSSVKEKVWYHSNCSNRGRGCYNTNLTDRGGCCIWYNEPKYLADIEEHLGITIDQVDTNLKVESNAFDGKVTYGQKRLNIGSGYKGHVEQLAPAVKELAQLETRAQSTYINFKYMKPFAKRP